MIAHPRCPFAAEQMEAFHMALGALQMLHASLFQSLRPGLAI